MPVHEPIEVRTAASGQRPSQLGERDHQVTDGDVGTQLAAVACGAHQGLDGPLQALTRCEQVGVVLVDAVREQRAQGADPLLDRGEDEAPQRLESIGLLGERALRLVRGAVHDGERDVVDQLQAIREVTVERRIADPGPSSDFVERDLRPELDHRLSGRADDPLPVAHGVRAQPVRRSRRAGAGDAGAGPGGGHVGTFLSS